MKLLIRADASSEKGSGHVMRCLALAEQLRSNASDIHFVCRHLQGNLQKSIEQAGFRCSLLAVDDANGLQQSKTNAIVDPLLDQARDARLTTAATDSVDWLIVDNYEIDSCWEQAMRPVCRRILVIDDLVNRAHDCDILLDQTFGRKAEQYRPHVANDCVVLTGTDYALLRPEFAAQRSAALARRAELHAVHTVLVSMGGSDPENKTCEVVSTLAESTFADRLDVTVATGAQYAHSSASLFAQADSFAGFSFEKNVSNMAVLMTAADIAIGASGTTSWERCCLGLPALIYVYADNQRDVAQSLQAAGATLRWRSLSELLQNLQEMMQNAPLYQSAVTAAFDICDGQGVDRVVSAMDSC